MSNNVHVVLTGDYYMCIAGIYRDRDEAERVARLVGGDVEVWELDSFGNQRIRLEDPGMDFFKLEMMRSGNVRDFIPMPVSRLEEGGERREESVAFRTWKDEPRERESYWRIFWCRYAESREAAEAACREIHRRILAGERPLGVDMGAN